MLSHFLFYYLSLSFTVELLKSLSKQCFSFHWFSILQPVYPVLQKLHFLKEILIMSEPCSKTFNCSPVVWKFPNIVLRLFILKNNLIIQSVLQIHHNNIINTNVKQDCFLLVVCPWHQYLSCPAFYYTSEFLTFSCQSFEHFEAL